MVSVMTDKKIEADDICTAQRCYDNGVAETQTDIDPSDGTLGVCDPGVAVTRQLRCKFCFWRSKITVCHRCTNVM